MRNLGLLVIPGIREDGGSGVVLLERTDNRELVPGISAGSEGSLQDRPGRVEDLPGDYVTELDLDELLGPS